MILYTLAPLSQQLLQPEAAVDGVAPAVACSLSGGYAHGVITPQGVRITRIDSTDPSVYLRRENDIGALQTLESFRKNHVQY